MSATNAIERGNNTNIDTQAVKCELLDKYTSRFSGLGRQAVRENILDCSDRLFAANKNIQFDKELAKDNKAIIRNSIKYARNMMRVDPDYAAEFCDNNPISPWLKRVIVGESQPENKVANADTRGMVGRLALRVFPAPKVRHGSAESNQIVDKLLKKNIFRSHVVGDKTFLNFLDWYNYMHRQSQLEIVEKVDENKKKFIGQIENAVKDGWIPQSAIENIRKLRVANHVTDDGYEIDDDNEPNAFTLTQYDILENTILFNPFSYKKISRKSNIIDDNYTHEAVHAISGDDHDDKYDDIMKEIFGNAGCGAIIDEAVTEHVAVSLTHSHVGVINPKRKTGAYVDERALLQTICTKGHKRINVRYFVNAHFENRYNAKKLGSESARAILTACLREAFPRRIMGDARWNFSNAEKLNKFITSLYARKKD